MLFVGDDWAEDHHDVEIVDETGRTLARRRFPEGLEGITRLHTLIAEQLPEPTGPADPVLEVVVGIEIERGPRAAAGYRVFAINPLSSARYRERHSTSEAKSDAGLAVHLLAVFGGWNAVGEGDGERVECGLPQVLLDVASSALRSGGDPAERFGDLGVAITCRVLVAHGCPRGGVTEPLHQFRECCPRGGRKDCTGVSEVMEA
jgi:Transposase